MFALFKGKDTSIAAAEALYQRVVAQARESVFYKLYGVPDTIDGRFDLITLHAFLVMNRLLEEGRAGKKLAQRVFDVMFRDMDRNLREMGIGDLSLPKHVKRMMKGFNGRANAYQLAMQAEEPDELLEAIGRNLYGSLETPPEDMVRIIAVYMHESMAWLAEQPFEALAAGEVSFKQMEYQQATENNDRNSKTGMVA